MTFQRKLTDALHRRLPIEKGSTLFKLVWKERTTPGGFVLPAIRASPVKHPQVSPNPVKDSATPPLTGWPSPVVNDSKGSDYTYANGDHNRVCLKLGGQRSWRSGGARISSSVGRLQRATKRAGQRSSF